MKGNKIIFIIFGLLALGGTAFYFFYFTGFSKKTKWESCVKECKEVMITQSFKDLCEARCAGIIDYQPPGAQITPIYSEDIQLPGVEDFGGAPSEKKTPEEKANLQNQEYYCAWTWPQKIIDKNTQEVIVSCPYDQPYCHYADYSYQGAACCKTVVKDGEKKEYFDCINLPDLLR